jgi:hypothetical protein
MDQVASRAEGASAALADLRRSDAIVLSRAGRGRRSRRVAQPIARRRVLAAPAARAALVAAAFAGRSQPVAIEERNIRPELSFLWRGERTATEVVQQVAPMVNDARKAVVR